MEKMEQKVTIHEIHGNFYSNSNLAVALHNKSFFGEIKDSRIVYNLYEALYLVETKKAAVIASNKTLSLSEIIKKYAKKDKNILQKYLVFKDLRNKGHILKAGLKFGVDFRCYEKGERPSREHAKYLVYIINEKKKLDIKDFCSKARIAHSTNKILLIAIVDSEEDITYFEVNWKR